MGNRYNRYEQERNPRYGSQQNYETEERRRYGSGRSDYDDDYQTGGSRGGYSQYGTDYGQESSYRTGSSYSSPYNRENYGFGRSGQGGSESERGYSSRGYQDPGYGRRGSGFTGQGAEDFTDWNWNNERYGGRYPQSERGYESDYGSDRGWWDRTSDEVASWFGDDEAARRREQDARREGTYRGRGPSGYVRSDERIREDINDRLTYHAFIDASNVNVEVQDGDVTLTGTVDNRFAKRRAEDISENVSGVKNVENRLRVSQSTYGQTTTTATGTTTSSELKSSKTA